jgi:hypothetical protein
LTDKQDTITNITDIGPRQIICNSIIGRNDSVITSDIIRAKDSLNFLKNNVYLNVSTELDSKQIKITDNDYLSISDVSGLTSALENVQVGDINISDVINLQTSLNAKQTKITENNFLSISDITGLSDKFDTKQDVITKNDNFIIDSMYVTPLSNKTTVNPTQTGELRASILKVEHDTLGIIDVGESINTLTTSVNGKQDEILSTSNFTLGTLDASGLITCGDLTINGEDIQALLDNVSGSGLTKSDIDGKQDILTAGNNITINTTTNTISATGEVTQADLNTKRDNLSATSLLTIATLNVMSELGVSTISDVPGEITCDSLIVGGTDIDTKIANASSSTDFDAFNATVTYTGFYRTSGFTTIAMFRTTRVNTKSNFTNNKVFTATIPGTYYFSLTVYSEARYTATVQIRKNNVTFESMSIPDDSIKIKYTMTTIIDLVAGDQVNSYSIGGFNMQPNETVFYGYIMNAAQVESSFVS